MRHTECTLKATFKRTEPLPILARRKPVSVSYNFITLISNLRVTSSAGVNLFTMQSARYRLLTTRFTLSVKTVRAPKERQFDMMLFEIKSIHSAWFEWDT